MSIKNSLSLEGGADPELATSNEGGAFGARGGQGGRALFGRQPLAGHLRGRERRERGEREEIDRKQVRSPSPSTRPLIQWAIKWGEIKWPSEGSHLRVTCDRTSSQFQNNCFTEMCSGPEEGSYLRLIDGCITQL